MKDEASFLPLFLEDGALAVYLEMPENERSKVEEIRKRLREAFSDSMFVAYNKLKLTRWTGEPIDVYANEIRKLARLSGFEEQKGLELVVKLAFLTGLPESVSTELQQVEGVDKISVADLLGRARVLTANKGEGALVAAGERQSVSGPGERKCFECSSKYHLIAECPRRKPFKCFSCGEEGHSAKRCPRGKKSDVKATGMTNGCTRGLMDKVPIMEVSVGSEGRKARALVDTGCTHSLMTSRMAGAWREAPTVMMAFDGRSVSCRGEKREILKVGGERIEVNVTVVDSVVGDIDVVLGMDVIKRLGGVTISEGVIRFGRVSCAIVARTEDTERRNIEDKDFDAEFDGKKWTVRYKWKEGKEPNLTGTVGEYKLKLSSENREKYEKEVERWIEEGVLQEWPHEVGGVLPLMAVVQQTKGKVRPVLDFRELNKYVECHTGDDVIDVCGDKLREWRRTQGEAEIVDLRAAYLQIRVSKDLWKHQLVRFRGQVYCLTRLGFGLNSAPRVMSKILKDVLGRDQEVGESTSSYIDDIYVNVSQIGADRVVAHLKRHGLEAKPPESLEGGSALGLRLQKDEHGALMFSRGNEVPEATEKMTKRELFSACGKLVGHYPVAGWLRVACSFVKRHAEGKKWTDYVDDSTTKRLKEIVERVNGDDPVKGRWQVPKTDKGKVWCDASDLALGVVVEIEDAVVEDAAWMRKKDDHSHINVAELEAVLKGINLGVKWGMRDITILTDSATVCGWVKTTMTEEKRVKSKGAAEMLVKRRLGVLKSMIEELGLSIRVQFVKSECNKADVLTRVKKGWLNQTDEEEKAEGEMHLSISEVKAMHDRHHMGVERTLFLARKVDPAVTKECVREVVRRCPRCQSIDPAPVVHEGGDLGMADSWQRLAIDVTHYRGQPYLTVLDCGPGRFAIWRRMRSETSAAIIRELEQIFYEMGPAEEILMDNAPAFKSEEMMQLFCKWKVRPFYRAAYRAGGNGIVERNHRTVKAMAERGRGDPIEACYWYNNAPRDRQKKDSVPRESILKANTQAPRDSKDEEKEAPKATVEVGEEVWVKPPNPRCTTQWKRGTVTKVNSENNVEVGGMPRHILDLRKVVGPIEEATDIGHTEENEEEDAQSEERRNPARGRRPPTWLEDYTR